MSKRTALHPLLTLILSFAACGDGGAGPDPSSREVASVAITPMEDALQYPGQSANFSAVARNAAGQTVPEAALDWQVDDPGLASVDGQGGVGVVTALGFGTVTVTARAENGSSGSATLRITGETSLAFLEGRWSVTGVLHPPGDGAEAVELTGASRGEAYPGGRVLVETLRLANPEGSVREVSLLHAPVGAAGGWATTRADGLLGTLSVLVGSFEPGTATFSTGNRFGGSIVERAVLEEQTADGFLLRVERSDDGGATWSPAVALTYRRDSGAELPAASPAPSGPCGEPPHGAFDYWLGTWSVESPPGSTVGSNTVERVADGCAVRENWRGADGSIGVSLTGWDARRAAWTQVYLDAGGGTLELVGDVEGEAMTLRRTTGNAMDRIRWIPLEEGSVRQLWETRTGEGPWEVFFDGYYVPEG